ncbi:unnamed protein product [Leptidea sinapis]|uniref:C2H2-type domain-containing protein n=1 Tax=Leptidea sinapis TaxID=189913 RepID=A0A5E4QZ33_9NEOP|nr:unnamed protein product [Leptidea sinapis]
MKSLRAILRVRWQDRVPNSEVLRRAKLAGMECMLMKGQLRWCGVFQITKKGKRKPGGQFLRYRHVLKRHLTAIGMSSESWEELAKQRSEWRTAVNTGIENFERSRLEDRDAKRLIRKTRPKPSYNYTRNSSGSLYCASCNRSFKTKFGFASHARAHARAQAKTKML